MTAAQEVGCCPDIHLVLGIQLPEIRGQAAPNMSEIFDSEVAMQGPGVCRRHPGCGAEPTCVHPGALAGHVSHENSSDIRLHE